MSYQYLSYYYVLVYHIDIILRTIQGDFFTVLHFVKRIVWYRSVFTQYSYYHDLFCLRPSPRLHDHHRNGWVRYIDITKIKVLSFLWDRSFFILYIYYRDFFCSRPALHLCNRHRHVGVRHIDTTKITVACMS